MGGWFQMRAGAKWGQGIEDSRVQTGVGWGGVGLDGWAREGRAGRTR